MQQLRVEFSPPYRRLFPQSIGSRAALSRLSLRRLRSNRLATSSDLMRVTTQHAVLLVTLLCRLAEMSVAYAHENISTQSHLLENHHQRERFLSHRIRTAVKRAMSKMDQ